MKYKSLILWLTAIAITFGAITYQRFTGPTYPKRLTILIKEGTEYRFKLPRSQGGTKDARVELPVSDSLFTAALYYKRYPTSDPWMKSYMIKEKGSLVGFLPNQPPAGKLEYYITILYDGQEIIIPAAETVIIRFRGDVPALIIIPHALLMFIAMLLSNLAALMALTRNHHFRLYACITTATLLVGGMILGPIVQKFAFGEFWTGIPFGFDLTDNKTLIAFIFWVIAMAGNWKKERPNLVIIAALVMLVVFSIPHSAMGSELDYETGTVKTGMILVREVFFYL
jgi:hypothetical protein